jgi:hypothetical protein
MKISIPFLIALFLPLSLFAQQTDVATALENQGRTISRTFEDTQRYVDDALWYFKLGDAANIQKYRVASSKPRRETNATAMSAGNVLVLPVYVFSPKNLTGKHEDLSPITFVPMLIDV